MSVTDKQLHHEDNTKKPCKTRKWEIADPTNLDMGQCTVNRTGAGAVWKRWVEDSNNMTCSRHEVRNIKFQETRIAY